MTRNANQHDKKKNRDQDEPFRDILSIGHDLNNKLSAMLGNLELFRMDQDISSRDSIDEILEIGEKARLLVSDLMKLGSEKIAECGDVSSLKTHKKAQSKQAKNRSLNLDECPGGTEKILLVDDDISFIRAQSKQLLRLGYHVTISQDGADAFEKISSAPERYALVITDQAMPVMDGLELAEKVSKTCPSQKMIMLTGADPSEFIDRFRKAGFQNIFQKPIDMVELSKHIRAEIDN